MAKNSENSKNRLNIDTDKHQHIIAINQEGAVVVPSHDLRRVTIIDPHRPRLPGQLKEEFNKARNKK